MTTFEIKRDELRQLMEDVIADKVDNLSCHLDEKFSNIDKTLAEMKADSTKLWSEMSKVNERSIQNKAFLDAFNAKMDKVESDNTKDINLLAQELRSADRLIEGKIENEIGEKLISNDVERDLCFFISLIIASGAANLKIDFKLTMQ